MAFSAFRTLERLPGPAAPAVYAVRFACRCADEHQTLVTHEDLDWRPLVGSGEFFLNLMTGKREPLADELLEQAAFRIKRGEWPWTLFCFPEERPRPVYPSAFRLVSPSEAGVLVGVRCPSCARTSVNVCSSEHVDVPFFNDAEVGVVESLFDQSESQLVDLIAELAAQPLSLKIRRLAA